MIITSLLNEFLNKTVYAIWFIDENNVKTRILEFDSIVEAGYKSTSQVTEYPLEDGTNVTDYKYNNPSELTLTGRISRTNSEMAGLSAYNIFDIGRSKLINKTIQALEKYKSGLFRLQVQTKSGLYDWMTLQDFSIPENLDNYGYFEVDMTFRQIVTPKNAISPAIAAYSDTKSIGQVFKGLLS